MSALARCFPSQQLSLCVILVMLGMCQPLWSDTFSEKVQPILDLRCVRCHGADEQNGQVRLDTLSADLSRNPQAAETWHDVLNALNLGEMPPADELQLTKAERTQLVDWLSTEIDRAIKSKRSTAGQVVLRRLNRSEYQNTMRDLLGLDIDYAHNLPPDELSADGFKNNGAALHMSAMQLDYFWQTARSALQRVIVDGSEPPVYQHVASETVADKVKENWSNRLGRTGTFVARVMDFPDEGEFVIRIRARAELADQTPYPRMHVTLGFRADTQTPSKTVASVDVPSETSQLYEFRGRIEEFPLQSRTQSKYPGLLIWIRNAYTDGQPAPQPKQQQKQVLQQSSVLLSNSNMPAVKSNKPAKKAAVKKQKLETVWIEDTDFPKIIIESLEFVAPVYTTWPPEHHRRIVPQTPATALDEPLVARDALRRFMFRAYRRPVDEADVQAAVDFFSTVRPTVDSFEQALRETLAMVLISPDFLYRVELQDESKRPLDDYEIASRLSYFLWNSMPDERLFELAADGRLTKLSVLESEVARMLADAKSWSFVEQFSNQWLDLDGTIRIAINPNYYPDFRPELKADMQRETQHFFAEVLHSDLSALNFLRSDFAMLNQPLAEHYGIPGPRGSRFERVQVPDKARTGGLLTQASVLLANSTGEDSHPIERGVWIRTALLNDPPSPPPPNVPNLSQEGIDTALLPMRRQLELHRENAACAHCHEKIDPWGIALEEYDAIGLRRETLVRRSEEHEKHYPIDATALLPDGSAVCGADELSSYLVEHQSRTFARALTSKLLTYALGRTLELSDEPTVDALTSRFIDSDYRLRTLIYSIVTSPPFLNH